MCGGDGNDRQWVQGQVGGEKGWWRLFAEVSGLWGFPFHNPDLSTKIVPLVDLVYGLNDFNDIL